MHARKLCATLGLSILLGAPFLALAPGASGQTRAKAGAHDQSSTTGTNLQDSSNGTKSQAQIRNT